WPPRRSSCWWARTTSRSSTGARPSFSGCSAEARHAIAGGGKGGLPFSRRARPSVVFRDRRAACAPGSARRLPRSSGPHQLPVLHPVRLVRLGAEPLLPVGLVLLVVALEPDDAAVALEGEDVGGDAVEEPA